MNPVKRTLWVISNTIIFFPIIYGIKCILMRRGSIFSDEPTYIRSYSFISAEGEGEGEGEGEAAVLGGISYIFLGLFVFFSVNPPKPDSKIGHKLLFHVLRWGSLLALVLFGFKANDS